MKKQFCCIWLFCFILLANNQSQFLLAQDDEFENYSFDDYKQSSTKLPYFALSFGGSACFLFMDFKEINNKPISPNVSPNVEEIPTWDNKDMVFSGPLIGWSFNLFSALSPLLNNARVGFSYQSGSQSKEYNPPLTTQDAISINFYRNINVSLTGVHFDYAFVPFKSLAVLPGLGVKFGNMSLEQYRTTDFLTDWKSGYNGAEFSGGFHNEKIEHSFIALEPQINLEYAITGFLMLRLGGSYSFTFDNPFSKHAWRINGNNKYFGVPSGVSPKGFQASVGLFIGLFNY